MRAWCLRFVNNFLSNNQRSGNLTKKKKRVTKLIIKKIFKIKCLSIRQLVNCLSKILCFNPLLNKQKTVKADKR